MTTSTAKTPSRKKTTKDHIKTALNHIDSALDPALLDVYPQDAIVKAQRAVASAKKQASTTLDVMLRKTLARAKDHIDSALDSIDTYHQSAQKADNPQEAKKLEQDALDRAFDCIDNARAFLLASYDLASSWLVDHPKQAS